MLTLTSQATQPLTSYTREQDGQRYALLPKDAKSLGVNLFLYKFISLFSLLGLCCGMGFPPVVASRVCSPVAVFEPLIAVALLIVEHRP